MANPGGMGDCYQGQRHLVARPSLLEEIRNYATHQPMCAFVLGLKKGAVYRGKTTRQAELVHRPCTCGFDAVLARYERR